MLRSKKAVNMQTCRKGQRAWRWGEGTQAVQLEGGSMAAALVRAAAPRPRTHSHGYVSLGHLRLPYLQSTSQAARWWCASQEEPGCFLGTSWASATRPGDAGSGGGSRIQAEIGAPHASQAAPAQQQSNSLAALVLAALELGPVAAALVLRQQQQASEDVEARRPGVGQCMPAPCLCRPAQHPAVAWCRRRLIREGQQRPTAMPAGRPPTRPPPAPPCLTL